MDIHSETIAEYKDFNNGAGPIWAYGSPSVMRAGERVFATVMEVDPEAVPLDNVVMNLYAKYGDGPWERVFRDDFRQREPCPIAMAGGRIIISTNPSLRPLRRSGPAHDKACSRPVLYSFDANAESFEEPQVIIPVWDRADHRFSAHSYRALAADSATGETLLVNIYSSHAAPGGHCWALMDRDGKYLNGGGLEYPRRSCYHSLAVRDGAAHAFSVSDIAEPNEEWKAFKREHTGKAWDYDLRILYYSYAADVRGGEFSGAVTVDGADETCGHAQPLDLHADENGDAHMLYYLRNIWHGYVRDRFFPGMRQRCSLNYCRARGGTIIERREIASSEESANNNVGEFNGFFHVMADGTVKVICKKSYSGDPVQPDGWYMSGVGAGSLISESIPDLGVDRFFNAKPRMGAAPSDTVDIYGTRGKEIKYVRVVL